MKGKIKTKRGWGGGIVKRLWGLFHRTANRPTPHVSSLLPSLWACRHNQCLCPSPVLLPLYRTHSKQLCSLGKRSPLSTTFPCTQIMGTRLSCCNMSGQIKYLIYNLLLYLPACVAVPPGLYCPLWVAAGMELLKRGTSPD